MPVVVALCYFHYIDRSVNRVSMDQVFAFVRLTICVTPYISKYAETESRRESATYILEENTPHIHAKFKVT